MKKVILLCSICFFFIFVTRGQGIVFVHQEFTPIYSINSVEEWVQENIGGKELECFRSSPTIDSENGWQCEEYKFKYKGIPVEYATLKVHVQNDKIKFINGEYLEIKEIEINPVISEDHALRKAKEHIDAELYIWESDEQKYAIQTKQEYLNFPPVGKLVICKDYMNIEEERIALAYKFEIYAKKPLSRNYVYVDAQTGKIIHVNPLIKHIHGLADTRYSGNRVIATEYYNGSYRLRDYDSYRGNGIETYNMRRGTNYSNATDFYDNDNNWTRGEHNNAYKDNAALDAHWGTMVTYDYYRNVHNRNSVDNFGGTLRNYVHADIHGMDPRLTNDNAFWNGSEMTYGDGVTEFDAVTSLDIIAHEITHGVIQHTANLNYSYESGALNESISDIFAACVENYAGGRPWANIWMIGEDISLNTTAIRYLYAPILGGQPSFYGGINWYTGSWDDGGVHTNSGVFNFWFCLLSNGGSGNNGGVSFSVSGIGINKAEKLVYKSLTEYFTPNTNYLSAASLTTAAAMELFGFCSNELQSVMDAWKAVGMTINLNLSNNLTITQAISSGTKKTYSAFNTIEASNIIHPNANVTYRAGNRIVLKPGFEAKSGSRFHAYIQECGNNFHPVPPNAFQAMYYDESDFLSENIGIKAIKDINFWQEHVIAYPNPTSDMVHLTFVDIDYPIVVSVNDIMGKQLLQQTIMEENQCNIDLGLFNAGIYLFTITSNKNNHSIKIVKK